MTLAELIARAQGDLSRAKAARDAAVDALRAIEDDKTFDDVDKTVEAISARDEAKVVVEKREASLKALEGAQADEERIEAETAKVTRTDTKLPAYDHVARVGQEERTYAPHKERGFDAKSGTFRRGSKPGAGFQNDVIAAFLGDYAARERLAQHQRECERDGYTQRAVNTGAFAGLVVPQYLTSEYAPAVAVNRPFADAINKHPLPAQGMTLNLSRITTPTTAALQGSENASVSNTDIDDTLLTIPVQTVAAQQVISRQAIDRGAGVEDVILDDMYRRYNSNLDFLLLNQATTGLTNVATSVTYTDASPTGPEAYGKIIEGLAGVEAALLDQATGENLAVMHSRRWYWLQNALTNTWPLIAQPGIPAQMLGQNYQERYGHGVRGLLPNGTAVIVDNNVATTLGGGTEDEIYLVDKNECHLWEDASAPMLIRAEQPAAGSLGVTLVIWGYFAYTHARYAHSRKVAGTGLAAPTFTGV